MTVYSLLESLPGPNHVSSDYAEKMLHDVPDVPVVKRYEYLLERARGKTILDIGCTGPFSPQLAKVAKLYHGIDREEVDGLPNVINLDVETARVLPHIPGLELVIASEILEHLINPGRFLELLRRYDCPIIITVPNAFSAAAWSNIIKGVESVNRDHVAWYSWMTLSVLLAKTDYEIVEWKWYNGRPLLAEGLIFEVKRNGDK